MRPLRILFALLAVATAQGAPAGTKATETVVLLHGLGRTPLSMSRLAHDLKAAGYEVRNLGYPSQRHDVRALANETLAPIFAETPPGARIHVVTHSLGGILLRQYLHDHGTPATLGRVVMLAPPNAGSEIVDRLRGWSLYRWINGPAGVQLGTDAASIPNTLGALPDGVEVGVIAGRRSLNPLFSAWLSGADDGKVTVASTHVAGQTAHVTVPHSHTWLMWRRPVLLQIRAFLQTGSFIPVGDAPVSTDA